MDSFVLDTPLAVCYERNRASNEPVPPEIIYRMAERWEPVTEEGVSVRVIDAEG